MIVKCIFLSPLGLQGKYVLNPCQMLSYACPLTKCIHCCEDFGDLVLLFVSCTTALMVSLRDFFLKAIFQVLASAVGLKLIKIV